MSTEIHTESHPRGTIPRLLAATLMVAMVGTAPRAAAAQDEGPAKLNPRMPLKRSSPFIKGRNLSIPGKLPGLNKTARKTIKKSKLTPRPPRRGPTAAGTATTKSSGKSFSNLKKANGKKCRPLPPTARVNFDFKGDIKELVESISKTTCKNFILTNKVRSQKFEIVSPSPITVAEAWRAFLSALEANDFTIIRVGRYHKIIQATDGTRSPLPLHDGRGAAPVNDSMVTVIWKLEHGGDVNAVVNYLNIFKSGKGQIHPFSATGTIIVTDFGTSIARLERILKEIDKEGSLEELHVVPVQFASATEMADKLTQIFEPQKAGPGQARKQTRVNVRSKKKVPKGDSAGDVSSGMAISKILADDRTNKLIIICSEKAFESILEVMRELDIPEDSSDGQIHVLSLKHADAEEMASTLSNLASGRAATPARARRTSKSKSKTKASSSAQLFQGEVKITADKATNSLVITASKSDLSSVKRVVEKLDIARYQVFVEAVIMEVATSRDTTVGAGWHGGYDPKFGGESTPILFGNTPNSELSSLITSANPLGLASLLGLAGALRGPTLDGSEALVPGGIPAIGVVLQAIQSTNDVNVISTPHLLTMDNEEAEIQVNEKRPFPSGLNLGGGLGGLAGLAGGAGGAAGALGNLGGLGLGSVSFNREDVGLTLKIKPQINDEDYVKLEIDQELSDVAGIDQVTNQVITSKRSAKTTVVVRSQDSIVIGGLVRDRETLDEAKTPLLGDIPILGWLFKRRQRKVEKVNLILVITPYIIRSPDDFRAIFERKMAERKEFVDRFYGTSADYRAKIDWRRKRGPLSFFNGQVAHEMAKAENGGPGADDEMIIRADDAAMPEGDAPPQQTDPVDTPPVSTGGE